MPTKGSYLSLITSESNIRKVKRMILLTHSQAKFLLCRYYISAGLHTISSFNFKSSCLSAEQYRLFLRDTWRLNNWYHQLKLSIISKMEFGPEAIRKAPRHSGSPRHCFKVLPDAPSRPWSFAKCSQTLQEHSHVHLKVPAVIEVHSGCHEIWLLG